MKSINPEGAPNGWRVKFWFLNDAGWTGIEFAFVTAPNAEKALSYAVQRAVRLGFTIDSSTSVGVLPEVSGRIGDLKV